MASAKLLLIKGVSSGFGRALASEALADGHHVVGTVRSDDAKRAFEALAPGRAHARILDLTDFDAIDGVVAAIEADVGPIDVLVNNAGITQDQLAMRMKDEEWDNVIATNLTAVGRLSRAVLRGMMKAKAGRIINITSVVGAAGNPGQMNYAAAKAGVAGMTRALAREIGSRNITVNCVAPGFIDTDMTKALGEGQHEALLTQIPLGRLGQPEDIAHAVAFLAGPQAAYITGSELHVNGGMYMN